MRTQILKLNAIQNVAKAFEITIGSNLLKKIIIILVCNNTADTDFGRITFQSLGTTNYPDFLSHLTMTSDVTINENQIFIQSHRSYEIPINYRFKKGEKIKMELYYSSGEREGNFSFIFL